MAIDYKRPFKMARSSKKYLTVSVDSKSGWPDAKFLRAPTTEKALELLTRYTADNGILRKIRTDPGTAFASKTIRKILR